MLHNEFLAPRHCTLGSDQSVYKLFLSVPCPKALMYHAAKCTITAHLLSSNRSVSTAHSCINDTTGDLQFAGPTSINPHEPEELLFTTTKIRMTARTAASSSLSSSSGSFAP